MGNIYVDGRIETTTTGPGIGSMTIASHTNRIGIDLDSTGNIATTSKLALARIAVSVPSDEQIRQMYQMEKPMFAANAKCLIHGAGTDVDHVHVDPITGKVIATASDSCMIWNGLAIESEPTIASGGTTWQHGLLFGDDRFEINDANCYATIAAKDVRGDLELVRGMMAAKEAGLNLGEAKAWIVGDLNATSIIASHNIESLSCPTTGKAEVTFARPFKSDIATANQIGYAAFVTQQAQSAFDEACFIQDGSNESSNKLCQLLFYTSLSTTPALVNPQLFTAVFFGELENE